MLFHNNLSMILNHSDAIVMSAFIPESALLHTRLLFKLLDNLSLAELVIANRSNTISKISIIQPLLKKQRGHLNEQPP